MRSSVRDKGNRMRVRSTRLIWLVGAIALTSNDAHAYIDPGTRSVIIQVLVGVFLALGITFKKWWPPLKRLVSRTSGDESEPADGDQ